VDIDVLMAELHDAIYVLRESRPSSFNQPGAAAWDLSPLAASLERGLRTTQAMPSGGSATLNASSIPGRTPASWPKIRKDVETSHGVAQVVVEGSIFLSVSMLILACACWPPPDDRSQEGFRRSGMMP
jgi:hypothetical protein